MTTDRYRFAPATLDDLALLGDWHAQPHVRRWWDTAPSFDARDMADPKVARWIVSCNDRPFAFMQDYAVHGWDDHHFAGLAPGSRGIDQFIGDPDMIGRGHGSRFIKARMRALFDAGVPEIATDPHPDNARAIAVYEKLGFRAFAAPMQTQWGLIVPMRVAP